MSGRVKDAVLLVDGDIFAYRAAAATDGRQYKVVYHLGAMEVTKYEKYKKEADKVIASLEADGHHCTLELEYEPEPLSHCLHLLDKAMKSLETQLSTYTDGISDVKVYLSEGGSFREKEFPSYKANRADMRRPAHLNAAKEHMKRKYGATSYPGQYEADDKMAMGQGSNSIICSIDKDLLQVPGHHFNFVKGVFSTVDEEQGRRSLYQQMLTGDKTDGIPGIKGIGPKTAEKMLSSVSSPFMMYCIVLKAYIDKWARDEGEDDETFQLRMVDVVRSHARLLYLLRSEDDSWEAPDKEEVNETI